eukprot:GHVT01060908.1.p1 GENE.GHVT01060908.1~~GHVT01060908.1.p1  ORF type:complete len:192 (+),score=27.81 GHVT01060908.1:244-819(+)
MSIPSAEEGVGSSSWRPAVCPATTPSGRASFFLFPAFRDSAWVASAFTTMTAPPAVLQGADLTPSYMASFETVGLYMDKVRAVKEELKRALFRQALFKVQNVEVMHLEQCRQMRSITRVQPVANPWDLFRLFRPRDVRLLGEEEWTVDRCGRDAIYRVRFYKEGGDGFSAKVFPTNIGDCYQALKFYCSKE